MEGSLIFFPSFIFFLSFGSPPHTCLSCGHPQWMLVRQACHYTAGQRDRHQYIATKLPQLISHGRTGWGGRGGDRGCSWVGRWKGEERKKKKKKKNGGGACHPSVCAVWFTSLLDFRLTWITAPQRHCSLTEWQNEWDTSLWVCVCVNMSVCVCEVGVMGKRVKGIFKRSLRLHKDISAATMKLRILSYSQNFLYPFSDWQEQVLRRLTYGDSLQNVTICSHSWRA